MSKPSEADRRLPLDHYPVRDGISEAELFTGYSGMERRIAPDRRERPLEPRYDESGLLHGEPVSDGRTAEKERE